MSGHSKWSTIKHKKAINDAKRANVFTKHAKLIEVAARNGGDPEMNFALRMAIDNARAVNMPKDNIERAIKRGTGEAKDGVELFEVTYEAYGPGQVSMLIQCITDNKNRTLTDVKTILKKNKGKFVEGGGVSWQFEQKGMIILENIPQGQQEEIEMAIIESGAEDYEFNDEGQAVVYTKSTELKKVQDTLLAGLKDLNIEPEIKIAEAKIILEAKEKVSVSDEDLEDLENLINLLDENDDVSEVWTSLNN